MSRERLIFRPNAIPPEIWEAMSREDQIAWWASQRIGPPKSERHMTEAISQYNKGVITLTGFVSLVCKLAAADEIQEFVSACPADLLDALKEALASYGDDESSWPRTTHGVSYAPWVTPEEIDESIHQEQQRIWDGVRLLKKSGPSL